MRSQQCGSEVRALRHIDEHREANRRAWPSYAFLITTQAKRNLSSRSGIGGVLSAT